MKKSKSLKSLLQEEQLVIKTLKSLGSKSFGIDILLELESLYDLKYALYDIFPLLSRLQNKGLINSEVYAEDPRRKKYFLSELGKDCAAIIEEFNC